VTTLRRFVSYYTRSSLPFLSGLAYGIFLVKWDHPLWMQVLAGLALVVLGPFVIQLVLTLIVDALRGVPEEPGVLARPASRTTVTRSSEPGGVFGRLTRER
jgi:hypothetical protein